MLGFPSGGYGLDTTFSRLGGGKPWKRGCIWNEKLISPITTVFHRPDASSHLAPKIIYRLLQASYT